ncbi:MAG TPA: protein phosphatase 2C domain-containing protein [Chloroflexota bacterium]|nr:protein phosphatase 2C domain-containing protein [Chloroflexota bacterium]
MTPSLVPRYAARTDTGRMRELNEDYVYAAPISPANGAGTVLRHLLMVADGVGGLERGEWASERAVKVVSAELPSNLEHMPVDAALRQAAESANERIWREVGSSLDPRSGPVATTLVAVVLEERQLWWANVGDSRAYLLGRDHIQQLTRDHSWTQEQVRNGLLTAEQARLSERRNWITRGVGYQANVEVDTGGPIAISGDHLVVLCSDGLHGLVTDPEIADVARSLEHGAAAERLIALSNERGGIDNISVVVCGFAFETITSADSASSSARSVWQHTNAT